LFASGREDDGTEFLRDRRVGNADGLVWHRLPGVCRCCNHDGRQASSPTPATPPDGAANSKAPHETPAAEPATSREAASKAKSDNTSLSVPACSMRYAAAKISGKLNGRQGADFRREECGEKDIEAVFAAAVAPKHSGEDLDKARTHTSADQFTANKVSNPNGGTKWVDKDGGYYAECVTRLKS
jgi:hypothetical protein